MLEENRLSYNTALEQEITKEFEKKFLAKSQKQPILILIGGFQGSGKSTLISRIKELYNVNVISTDAIRQSLFNKEIQISHVFSKYVSNIYQNLLNHSLSKNSHTIIDANAHSKRIEEIEKLLIEKNFQYLTIKVFLNASEETLRSRIRSRTITMDCYQGTEADLDSSLSSSKIKYEDYNLIIETDQLNRDKVFEIVNDLIMTHFS